MSIPVLSVAGPAFESLIYTDPLGNEVDLSTIPDEQYKEGLDGRFMVPVEHRSTAVPGQYGARYREARALPRQLSVPLTLVADNVTDLRAKVRELSRQLNPLNGLGKLTLTTYDGLSRCIECVYEDGFGLDPATVSDSGFEVIEHRVVIVFRAFDPFWYDISPVSKTFASDTSSDTFFPGPPWRLGASNIFTDFSEVNEGDIEAWPVWTINGPGTNLELRNETTGETLMLDLPIATEQQIVIDTRPDYKSVTSSGSNLFGFLRGSLWSLRPGANDVTVILGETVPSTYITLNYVPGYNGV